LMSNIPPMMLLRPLQRPVVDKEQIFAEDDDQGSSDDDDEPQGSIDTPFGDHNPWDVQYMPFGMSGRFGDRKPSWGDENHMPEQNDHKPSWRSDRSSSWDDRTSWGDDHRPSWEYRRMPEHEGDMPFGNRNPSHHDDTDSCDRERLSNQHPFGPDFDQTRFPFPFLMQPFPHRPFSQSLPPFLHQSFPPFPMWNQGGDQPFGFGVPFPHQGPPFPVWNQGGDQPFGFPNGFRSLSSGPQFGSGDFPMSSPSMWSHQNSPQGFPLSLQPQMIIVPMQNIQGVTQAANVPPASPIASIIQAMMARRAAQIQAQSSVEPPAKSNEINPDESAESSAETPSETQPTPIEISPPTRFEPDFLLEADKQGVPGRDQVSYRSAP
jgi:hypothetical protein